MNTQRMKGMEGSFEHLFATNSKRQIKLIVERKWKIWAWLGAIIIKISTTNSLSLERRAKVSKIDEL